jgi:hypothetical protein
MAMRLWAGTGQVERPAYVWLAGVLEVLTAFGAIPVGVLFILDPSGGMMGMDAGWMRDSPFGSYLVPGLYLLLVNGLGMLALAALTVRRHPFAPWLTGALGVGMIIWILVEIVVLPETSFLTWMFLAVGLALGVVALFWLRRTGQLRRA